jgi:DNA-binding transcriptional LysR family regulator
MNNQFDWTLIRSFLAALDHGSLLAAARATHVSQPTIGRHISELETQLDVVLFERTGRGLLPTQMAERLADSARAMEAGANQLLRSASAETSSLGGTVRITASQTVACVLLPGILAQMRLVLPDIQVEVLASDAVSNLLRREADIALRMARPDQGSLIAKRIGEVRVCACAHNDYLRRRGVPRQMQDLLNHELVGEDQGDQIIKGFAAFGYAVEKTKFGFRTDDSMAYWRAVQVGLGIGFVADFMIRTDTQVAPLLPTMKIPPLPVWLTVHREIRTNQRIRAVYDFFATALPKAF